MSSPLVLVSYKIADGNSYHPLSRCSMEASWRWPRTPQLPQSIWSLVSWFSLLSLCSWDWLTQNIAHSLARTIGNHLGLTSLQPFLFRTKAIAFHSAGFPSYLSHFPFWYFLVRSSRTMGIRVSTCGITPMCLPLKIMYLVHLKKMLDRSFEGSFQKPKILVLLSRTLGRSLSISLLNQLAARSTQKISWGFYTFFCNNMMNIWRWWKQRRW